VGDQHAPLGTTAIAGAKSAVHIHANGNHNSAVVTGFNSSSQSLMYDRYTYAGYSYDGTGNLKAAPGHEHRVLRHA
jgi:hypothetical protein